MQLHVGTALRGDIRAYAKRFDLCEVLVQANMPRASRLRQMVEAVPESFVFSVVLPRDAAALDADPGPASEAVEALGAKWLVVRTEPDVRPSARTRARLGELVKRLPSSPKIAWEPRGLWETNVARALAEELEICLVGDASRDEPPPGSALYTRIRALGRTGIAVSAIERVAELVGEYELACVMLDGAGAPRGAQMLRELAGVADESLEEGEAAL